MYNFNKNDFAEIMQRKYGIVVDKRQVGEESINLYKDELDEQFISQEMKNELPMRLVCQTCSYISKNDEWIISIFLDEDNNSPVLLVCLENGVTILEERV
ncbi:hypothetical protein [Sporolactobacillus sp. KGMB 08714]|uniref:hypothetical protein n=1 Tax=Sporolactobacillus sp. KGMB 08714 TaxID=3064704 RepID=UPI002FBEF5CF